MTLLYFFQNKESRLKINFGKRMCYESPQGIQAGRKLFSFLDFPIYLQSVEIHSANGVLGSEGG
jgi:hypothetical protein